MGEFLELQPDTNQDVLEAVNNQMFVIYQYTERQLNEIEIKYIAVHVCAAIERKKNKEVAFRVIVACHAGIGTSRLLLEKLKRHFIILQMLRQPQRGHRFLWLCI